MNERLQAVLATVFVLIVGVAVAVVLMHRDEEPAANPAHRGGGSVLDSAESPPTGLLAFQAGRKNLLLRFRTGSCTKPGGPKLEISTNFGRTFKTVHPPQIDTGGGIDATSPTVPSIVRASASSPRKLVVYATDRKCVVRAFTSNDGGASWAMRRDKPRSWYMDPKTGVSISPKGPTDNGCKKSALLASIDTDTAVVVCENGSVRRTTDGGETWFPVGRLEDQVTAVVFASPTDGFATTRGSVCASRVQVTTDGGATWRPSGCVAKQFAIPALAVVGDRLIAGGTAGALVSEDQGQTWSPSKKK